MAFSVEVVVVFRQFFVISPSSSRPFRQAEWWRYMPTVAVARARMTRA